jgi:phage shock protein A
MGCDAFYEAISRAVADGIAQFLTKGQQIMATLDELVAKVGELKVKVDGFGPAVDGLEQKIRDALATENLSPATQAKIDAAFADVQTMIGTADTALADAADPTDQTPTP